MKTFNFSFFLLPLFSFASTILDFNNLDVQNQIIEKATEELQVRIKGNGSSLSYLPFDQVPFTAWRKSFHPNGQLLNLQQYKEGVQHGSAMEWYSTGQMKWQIILDFDKVMSAKAWTPDGAPCPITRVVNGNGIGVIYDESGSVTFRKRWENGKEVHPFKK